MKKLMLISWAIVFLGACNNDNNGETTVNSQASNTLERLREFDQQLQDASGIEQFNVSSERLFGKLKSSKNECLETSFNLQVEGANVVGFSSYTQYSLIVIDYLNDDCASNGWNGRLEYYIANDTENGLKDSLVLKNVSYGAGYGFTGYRMSKENPGQATLQEQSWDAVINVVVADLDGKQHQFNSTRSLIFRDRFTTNEQIKLIEDTTVTGIDENYFVNAKSSVNAPLLFDASCFDGASFLKYPTKGIHDFTSSLSQPFTVDYGTGNCDKEVMIFASSPDEGFLVTLL